jgi:ubiquinone/menaquinone biosynthesis C-methylase UbiE
MEVFMKSVPKNTNIDKQQILSEWKKNYTQALISSLKPTGDVLEIGFGIGIGSELILKNHPKSLTIIEPDSQIAAAATNWAKQHKNVTVIEGNWQTILPQQGKFDAIFFNYSLDYDVEIISFLFQEEAKTATEKAKKVLQELETEVSKLTNHFSDKEIDDFYKKLDEQYHEKMPRFLLKLKENGNITKTQYDHAIKKYGLDETKMKSTSKEQPDEMLSALNECLKSHLNKNGRFSAFLCDQTSKYEDSKFFNDIISNSNINFSETSVQIETPDQKRNGLVIMIEKA